MNREIKFRGFQKSWIYGGITIFQNEATIFDINCVANSAYEVDINSVGQYTGFKDFEGKEIYEGDILEYVHFANALIKRKVVVEFDSNCGGWYVTKHFEYLSDLIHKQHNEVFKKSQGYESCSNHNVRIIGNIYENSDLLHS